ncbi:MAG: hypothetical protein ACXWX6_08645, partial [Actinomycetota bacterium]
MARTAKASEDIGRARSKPSVKVLPKRVPKVVSKTGRPKVVKVANSKAEAKVVTKVASRTAKPKRAAPSGTPVVTRERPGGTDDELAGLWVEYKQNASPAIRERLILHYAPLVKYVASRVATGLPASVDQADLVSYG